MDVLDAIAKMPWEWVVMACLTLGLAPYAPPHIVEKLQMLARGTLRRPIDWFDLVFHGVPWAILLLKIVLTALRR